MINDESYINQPTLKTNNQEQISYTQRPFEKIFHSAVARILDFLIIYRDFDYSESDIARKTNLTYKTVAREMPNLLEQGIIILTRLHGRTKMYKINEGSDKVRGFIQFMDSAVASNHEDYNSS